MWNVPAVVRLSNRGLCSTPPSWILYDFTYSFSCMFDPSGKLSCRDTPCLLSTSVLNGTFGSGLTPVSASSLLMNLLIRPTIGADTVASSRRVFSR